MSQASSFRKRLKITLLKISKILELIMVTGFLTGFIIDYCGDSLEYLSTVFYTYTYLAWILFILNYLQ